MKYLNKIIFINSANIPYAEIAVDGNVHFTGTQGVGKSTVLRALLFFYNADKHRLGIQQGQKSFDEFYFRQSNSYILYEVMRDNGAYTIMVSRYQGRASWRFIDAPYQREWFVADDRRVLSDWVKIRERIDKNVAVSARIESGVMFKDIIFGNTHDHKYTRYAIVQSSHYQNIPRSIQNVFLNTKLDADFVKNTIIQSMADEEVPIDLQTYRRLVTDFEREYDEIDCWFRQTRDGNYPVRQQALKIAEQGRKIVALDQQLLDIWRMLNHAVAYCEQHIPLLETEATEVKAEIEKEHCREKELTAEYNKEKDSFNQELGAEKSKLKEIAQARKSFEAIGMEDKLILAAREPAIKQEVADKQALLDDLLKTHASIEDKYNIARGKLENARQAFENVQKEAYWRKQTELQTKRKNLDVERTKNRSLVMDAFNSWRHESDERLQFLLTEQHRADNALKELRQWHPMADDITLVDEQLQQLNLKEKENTAQQTAVRSQIDKITAEYELKETDLRHTCKREQESLEADRAQIRTQIVKIDDLLAHLDGSLYKWLCENTEGWENTIGKVVDEERILYAQGLEPQLDTASDNLFGIRLNLDNIASVHRTPDEYRLEKKNREEQMQQINRQLTQLPITLQNEIEKLGKKYATQLNPLRQKATLLKVEEEQIPMKRQNLQNQRHKLEMEEHERIEQEKEIRERSFNEALLKVQAEKAAREKREARNKKELKELDTLFNRGSKALDEELRIFKESQDEESSVRNRDFSLQKKQLEEQRNEELSGRGVNMQLLEQYQKTLDGLNAQLSRIESERAIVIRYRDAEQNQFAKEPEIKKAIKAIEQQLSMMRQRYEDKRTRMEKKRKELEERQHAVLKELTHRKEGLNLYHQMVENEHLVPDDYLSDGNMTETHHDCQQLLSQLRGTVNQKRESIDTLKALVVNFNRNFKPQNAFHFNTMPVTDNDYLQIAGDLQDFMDNNKIEEFRRRTSEHYKDILGRISTEIGSLMKRRSDVDGVILDINRDFVEKNFAGVIKSIELRANESSDRLMQLLMSIHDYTVENALSIGELNLFSSSNRDEVNRKVVDYLKSLSHYLQNEPNRPSVSLGDAFRLQFRVKENDNDTNWVERINNVGSDGTDILVKAMVNIMLINVFKKKAARKSGDFIVHCMMDEIGRLHPNNIKGILQFANSRNIYLINSSPTSYNPYDYRYTYLLSKHEMKTRAEKLLKRIK
ncbi:MAG: ATP-binding protein [Bacteroidales bacterium]|nr:ATP-binding protein [Bacteroidales bacterium]MCM1146492.1 ATP-binding protein [Bacteroidales bacterium]MCM1205070.1 ATP-binding protein [Bacillota bacterium]MCM1509316.1 ATP-binding protein [Clostridium sp.]